MQVEYDAYKDAVNSEVTFNALAEALVRRTAVYFGWTDQRGTHLEILMALSPFGFPDNNMQRGVRRVRWLHVGVSGLGCFAFDLSDHRDIHWEYAFEKLNLGSEVTASAVAELIMGVREFLTGQPASK